jgi:heavy metal translocating P-type ATPase
MMCSFCVQTIDKALRRLNGVERINVSLAHEEALVGYDPGRVSAGQIVTTLTRLGYEAWRPGIDEPSTHRSAEVRYGETPRLLLCAYVAAVVMLSMLLMFTLGTRSTSMDLILLVVDSAMIFGAGWPILTMSWYALRQGILNQHVLLTYGALGGYVASILALFFPITSFAGLGAMLIFAHVLSGYASSTVKQKASQAVERLLRLQPPVARVLRDEQTVMVPVDQVEVGDLMLVKPGEKIPTDGVVRQGHAAVDEALVTGESMPVEKGVSDPVIGATLSTDGVLYVEATRVGSDTVLARIARFVEESKAMKPPIVLLADQVLKYYVPGVLLISGLSFVGWMLLSTPLNALFAALSVAVIGYPCALGLSTPLALMRGTGLGAERGVLIRSGMAFQRLKDVDTVLFDKTGTLTPGRPVVTDVVAWEAEQSDFLHLAASVEALSEHPLAAAIVHYARSHDLKETLPVEDFIALPGRGVRARLHGDLVLVGKPQLLAAHAIALTSPMQAQLEQLAAAGKTVVLVARAGGALGLVALQDAPKRDAAALVDTLRRQHLRVALMTGDNLATARAIGRQVGIDDVVAEILPEDKARIVRQRQEQGQVIAMVGDGINDAPALAQADVGMAMGAGTDIAIESADVVLLGEQLSALPAAIDIGIQTYAKIRQNLLWAFCFNAVGIPIAASGWLHPTIAIAAMASSTLGILLNSFGIRLSRLATFSLPEPELHGGLHGRG